MLLQQLTEIGSNENETIREFNTRFDKLLQRIPRNIFPERDHLIFLYTKAFPGHLGFMVKDKIPKTLEEAKELATKIEANIFSCKVEPFIAPNTEAGPTQDANISRDQKLDEAIRDLTQTQTLVMNKVTSQGLSPLSPQTSYNPPTFPRLWNHSPPILSFILCSL